MLEQYFFKPDTVESIKSSWIGDPIERYVRWMSDNGYSFRTVVRRVPILKQFGEFARQRGAQTWEELPLHIEPFIAKRVQPHKSKTSSSDLRSVSNPIRSPIDQMLTLILSDFQGHGRSRFTYVPFFKQAPGFFDFLCKERGLKEASLDQYHHYLKRLESYLDSINLSHLEELSPTILSAFIIGIGGRLSKNSISGLCSSLRIFLRYLYQEHVISRDLSLGIEGPRRYQLADVPRSITWGEIRTMLEIVDRRTALGKRDYAILLLLITYGLRGHEVADLTLEHLDWERERLLVPERKANHNTAYPLSTVVGNAILEYLKLGRPETEDRHLFFRVLAPIKPVLSSTISNRVTHYLRKANIHVCKTGSHTLRHSCVQRLVDADFSFKVIGDYVGHASPSSTAIYTKIDLEALREIAMGHGEELL